MIWQLGALGIALMALALMTAVKIAVRRRTASAERWKRFLDETALLSGEELNRAYETRLGKAADHERDEPASHV